MTNIRIAFDVDGTLIDAEGNANLTIVELLITLSKMKNTIIIVWSGGGRDYAKRQVGVLGIEQYVGVTMAKDKDFHVDVAIDDQHLFDLADKNIIVRMK